MILLSFYFFIQFLRQYLEQENILVFLNIKMENNNDENPQMVEDWLKYCIDTQNESLTLDQFAPFWRSWQHYISLHNVNMPLIEFREVVRRQRREDSNQWGANIPAPQLANARRREEGAVNQAITNRQREDDPQVDVGIPVPPSDSQARAPKRPGNPKDLPPVQWITRGGKKIPLPVVRAPLPGTTMKNPIPMQSSTLKPIGHENAAQRSHMLEWINSNRQGDGVMSTGRPPAANQDQIAMGIEYMLQHQQQNQQQQRNPNQQQHQQQNQNQQQHQQQNQNQQQQRDVVIDEGDVNVNPALPQTRSRAWVFTFWYPEAHQYAIPGRNGNVLPAGIDYFIAQLEQANADPDEDYVHRGVEEINEVAQAEPREPRQHLQGFIQTTTAITRETLMRRLNWLHAPVWLEISYKPDAAIKYCTKEDTRVSDADGGYRVELGRQHGAGAVTDFNNAAQMAAAGVPFNQIVQQYPGIAVRYANGLMKLVQMNEVVDDERPVTCFCFWGETGTGKTTSVKRMEREVYNNYNVYKKPADSDWWDGYNDQEAILLDEFHGQFKITQMLEWLDTHAMRVPIKGGFVSAKWKRVYICSNIPPHEWYPKARTSQLLALWRRLPPDNIVQMRSQPPTRTGSAPSVIVDDSRNSLILTPLHKIPPPMFSPTPSPVPE